MSTLVAPGARRSARSTLPVGSAPAAGGGVGGSSGEHEQGWESPDSMTLEASPESLQGGSPASGPEDSNGAAPTHPTGMLPLNADTAEPLWQRDLVEELTKAKAVGDVLALGHDAEVLAVAARQLDKCAQTVAEKAQRHEREQWLAKNEGELRRQSALQAIADDRARRRDATERAIEARRALQAQAEASQLGEEVMEHKGS